MWQDLAISAAAFIEGEIITARWQRTLSAGKAVLAVRPDGARSAARPATSPGLYLSVAGSEPARSVFPKLAKYRDIVMSRVHRNETGLVLVSPFSARPADRDPDRLRLRRYESAQVQRAESRQRLRLGRRDHGVAKGGATTERARAEAGGGLSYRLRSSSSSSGGWGGPGGDGSSCTSRRTRSTKPSPVIMRVTRPFSSTNRTISPTGPPPTAAA